MNIYFTASTSFNGQLIKDYKRILSLIKRYRHKLISGAQIVDKKLLEKDKKLLKKIIFKRQKRLIDQADCLIAESSKPSLGVGGEITYALMKGKPVLALVKETYEDKISPMVAGNPSDNLFLEYYNKDKLKFVLKEFLSHIEMTKKRRGKLIVIDGGDGSGKTTQAKLLVNYLKKRKIPLQYVDFPQYYHSFHGRTVARFLRGEFGSIDQVSPYLASLAYALDRASVKQEMEEFLKKGGFIVANRYATSNMAHQGAKFKDKKQRDKFLRWVYDLEYKIHKIPKEDLVIYLYVPWKVGLTLTKKKSDRRYLKGKTQDIQEKDYAHRRAAQLMYSYLCRKYKHWRRVNCVEKEKLLSPEKIHKKILKIIEPFLLKFDK